MTRTYKLLGSALVSVFLVACTSTATGPVVIRDAGTSSTVSSTSTQVDTQKTLPTDDQVDRNGVVVRDSLNGSLGTSNNSSQPDAVTVQPVSPAAKTVSSASPLKNKLIQQSQQQLAQNNLEGAKAAIVLAERGLRIDRKEPAFYEVLALAYDQMGVPQQSRYFAQQGVRYASKGSAVYRSLTALAR